MAQWATQRAGNWSSPGSSPDSPWFASEEESGDLTSPGDGDTVVIRHKVTVDVDVVIGRSLQAAIWEPLTVSLTGGSDVTALPSRTYTISADVESANGRTQVGNTVSAPLVITQGTSKPRVTFAEAPPTGCSYNVFLSDSLGDNFLGRSLYCGGVIGTTLDLTLDGYGFSYAAGVPAGTNLGYANSGKGEVPPHQANAVTITSDGSLIVADGKRLLIRGDLAVESSAGSTKDFIQVGKGATYRIDGSQATDPTRAGYIMSFQGGGDIHFAG